ncbi:MAG TPA: preprotein translocase subunit YajC [Burkholderiales bacterium]|nr:preprotein translocase subunit YajC [Burkholderiales bacterium]
MPALLSARAATGDTTVLINEAWAQGAGVGPGGGLESMLLIVLMFVVLYFLMIRPQMKRAKEHKAMIEALQRGDEVVTSGGVLGRISKLNENYVTLEVASNVEIQVQRPSVQLVLPKGTLKNIQ